MPRPDIVLLDLKLPTVDGENVLHEIKHHPELEILENPVDLSEFVEVIRLFDRFRVAVTIAD